MLLNKQLLTLIENGALNLSLRTQNDCKINKKTCTKKPFQS